MKRNLSLIALVFLIGCATTLGGFTTVAGKFLTSTAIAVDASMQGWAKWVALGKATPADEAAVKTYYQQYQADMMVATNAYNLAVQLSDPSLFTTPSNKLFSTKTALVGMTLKGN